MSDRYLQQRIDIKFCVKLGRNGSEICAMRYEAYGEESTKKSSVSESYKRFKVSRVYV
jgi:hypothetical protein